MAIRKRPYDIRAGLFSWHLTSRYTATRTTTALTAQSSVSQEKPTRVDCWEKRFAELTGMVRAALWSVSRGMTGGDTTPAIKWGKRSVDQVIMEGAALDGVPLEMTREMDISTVIGRETKSVYLVGKGHPVNDAWKTGLVLVVLHTVYLKTVTSLDITSKLFHMQFAQMCKVFQGVFYCPC